MLETEELFEEIGSFWEMSSRQFSSLSEKEVKYYENLKDKLLKFEGNRENDNYY